MQLHPAIRTAPASAFSWLWIFAALALGDSRIAAQEPAPMQERLAVFLDCGFCDGTFLRQEMEYVDWVLDREVADVHVLVTQQTTGAGGQAQTFDLPYLTRDLEAVDLDGNGLDDLVLTAEDAGDGLLLVVELDGHTVL